MTATSPIAVTAASAALVIACAGCASRAVPSPRSVAYGPVAMYGAPASAPAYAADLDDEDPTADAALGLFARPRKKKRGAIPIPWLLPAGWSLPGLSLPAPWTAPSPKKQGAPMPSPGAPLAIAYARSKLGLPYCWGGSGPGCYDCSGLTSASWKAGGKAIPRTSEGQAEGLPEVPLDRALPGDILWRPGHVALYIGDGKIIQAPHTGDVVKISPAERFVKALRP
ncbi:MAG: C40 family peptidase [Polyangiaceae bacterium]